MLKIDSHHHLWRYNSADYGWIPDLMACLRRDFLLPELRAALDAANVQWSVAVQARQSEEETEFLLALAGEASSPILGVVGFLPLAADDFPSRLETFAAEKKLKGLRHVVQDEPDDRFLLDPAFNRGIRALKRYDLAYDILIFERQLPAAIEFVDLHPNQRFVLDHIAKPGIKAAELEPWRSRLRELARRPNVCCKLSGMATEADMKCWTIEQLTPYFETVLEAFGPERLLFGSDWPVLEAAGGYEHWISTLEIWTSRLSQTEQELFWYKNATTFYHLEQE